MIIRSLRPETQDSLRLAYWGYQCPLWVRECFCRIGTPDLRRWTLLESSLRRRRLDRRRAVCCIVVAGYVPSVALAWRGLSFRGVPDKLRILARTPLHWLLLSGAAWWAAIELTHAPFRWNKTEHGLDRRPSGASPLVELSRCVAGLEGRGELPQIWIDATYNVAGRRRLPRASA